MKLFLYLTLFCFATSLFGSINLSDKIEARKKITKTFDAPSSKTIAAINKYGRITVVLYNGSQVKYDIEVIARSSSKEKAEKELERVSVIFEDRDEEVVGTTEIGDKSSWFNWSWSENTELEINYIIYTPDSRKLRLSQKYGNILLPNYNGPCNLDIAYGNLEGADINATLQLSLRYGNGKMGCLKNAGFDIKYSNFVASTVYDANVNIKYGEFDMDHAHNLNFDSKYSNFKLGNVANLKIDGGYDQYEVREAMNVMITNNYGGIELKSLTGNLDINSSYHTTKVGMVKSSCQKIQIEGNYSNIKLGFESGYTYAVEGKYMSVSAKNKHKEEEEDGAFSRIKGSTGAGKGAEVMIKGNYIDVGLDK